MTLSIDERNRQEDEVLRKTTEVLGDEIFIENIFNESMFPDISNTTWKALYDRGLLERSQERGTRDFYLKADGWIRGLELTGGIDDPQLIARLGDVCASARKYAADRSESVIVYCVDFAKDAGVPVGWLANVISADLIRYKFNRIGPTWAEGFFVKIPLDVGMTLI